MWKSVENFSGPPAGLSAGRRLLQAVRCCLSEPGVAQQPLSACSACAGDYEDPDRTAWTPDAEEDETHSEERTHGRLQVWAHEGAEDESDNEFPAQEA